MAHSILRILARVFAGVSLLVANGQSVHHLDLTVGSVSPPDAAGRRSAELTVRALGVAGQPIADASFTSALTAAIHRPAGVVISEIALDGTEIELVNAGNQSVDMAGWILEAGQGWYERGGAAVQVIPGPAVLAPGEIAVWSAKTNAENTFPRIRNGQGFPGPRPHVIEIRDSGGALIDQVLLSEPESGRQRLWGGPPVNLSGLSGGTIRRVGTGNRYSAQDWVAGTNTVGAPNPGLLLPWAGPRTSAQITPEAITLANGVWRGEVIVAGRSGWPWTIGARSPDNLVWETGPHFPPPAPPLRLVLVEGSLAADEARPGRIALARVELPPGTALSADLPVSLSFSTAGEFSAPSVVIIPAGGTSADFELRSEDDHLADGTSRVLLTAAAAGFSEAEWVLGQADNEVGKLHLQIPRQAGEWFGLLTRMGTVSLPSPAAHDTVIALESFGRVWAPASVRIPEGATSGSFPVRVVEDSRFNVAPVRDGVTASVPGWPSATDLMQIEERQFPSFRIELPQWIDEGTTAQAALVFDAAPDRPVTVRLSVRGTALRVPEELTLPTGTNRVAFEVVAPDDRFPGSGDAHWICAETDQFVAECRPIQLRDDDYPIASLSVSVPPIVFSPGAVPVTMVLRDAAGLAKRISGDVRLRVVRTYGNVRVAGGVTSVSLVNGQFSGTVPLEGAGEETVMEATMGDQVGLSEPFSVVAGRAPALPVADIASWPGHANLLALLVDHPPTGAVGRLVELDPASGMLVREMTLPFPAHRLAVSESGAVAWLASLSNTVQRIQLDEWSHSGVRDLGPTNAPRHALLVAVSPGTTDDIAVLTAPTRVSQTEPFSLIGFRGGERLDGAVDLGTQPYGPGLTPGRMAGEFFATLTKDVVRVALTGAGLEVAARRNLLDVAAGYVTQPALVGTNLVFAGGLAVVADTLADAGEYAPASTWPLKTAVLAIPDLGLMVFTEESGRIRSYRIGSREPENVLGIPQGFEEAPFDRLVRWGERGVAMVSWSRGALRIVDHGAMAAPVADLGISVSLPSRVAWPNISQVQGSVPATIVVTNRGPDVATKLRIEVTRDRIVMPDYLLPGDSVVLEQQLAAPLAGPASFTVGVAAETADPDSGNNSATTSTVFEPPAGLEQSVVELRGRHLVARPDGSELWVATGPEFGFEGVVGLDPLTGDRIRQIELGPDPRRLAPAADHDGIYVQLGVTRLVRWNLLANAPDFERDFGGEQILDFANIPGAGDRLAVLTRSRLLVLDGTNQIQAFAMTATTNRILAVGGGQVWTARGDDLRVYVPTAGGLNLIRNVPVYQANGDYRFTTDGRWAGFGDHVFDPASGQRYYTETGSAPLIPSPDGTFFGLAGSRIRRLALPNLLPVGEASVPALVGAGAILDQVRWGADGFAFRTESGHIVSIRSAAVPSGEADLGVSINPVGTPYFLNPSEFLVVVTNRGPDAVRRVEVSVASQLAASVTSASPHLLADGSIRIPGADIPAGQSREFRFSAVPKDVPFPSGRVGFTVRVTGSANDPNLADNYLQTDFLTRAVPADLGIWFELPATPTIGAEFDAYCVLTNAGPAQVANPEISFRGFRLVRFIGTETGRFVHDGAGGGTLSGIAPTLASGSSVRVRLRLRVDQPGVYGLRASLNHFVDDPDPTDNLARASFIVMDSGANTVFPHFATDFARGQWSPARSQWIVGDEFGVTFLDAATLAPEGGLTFSSEVSDYFQNLEGTHLWLARDAGFDRYDFASGRMDLRVSPDQVTSRYHTTVATLPGRTEDLVVFGLNDSFNLEASIVSNGRLLPDTYRADLVWNATRLVAAGGPDNRVFISNGGQLRELEVTPTGLRFVRNLDAYQRHIDSPMAISGGLLVQGFDEALDLTSLTFVPVGAVPRPIFDALAFRLGVLPDGSSRIESFDLLQRRPLWAIPVNRPELPQIGAGNLGMLALGLNGGLIGPPSNREADLRLRLIGTPDVPGAGYVFPMTFSLQQSGSWLAGSTRIKATLPAGMELVEPAIAGTAPEFTVPFFLPSTNVTVRLRASSPGPIRLSFHAESDLADPTPNDARVDLNLVVPDVPVVLLSDLTVDETGKPFVLRLSNPAPEDITVRLRAEPITTEADDLLDPEISVTFAAGRSEAEVFWIRGDADVEEDEQFRMSVATGTVRASAPSVVVTIRNDDRAEFRTVAVNRPEGNAAAPTAVIQVWTVNGLEVPAELGFVTVPGTAASGEDYLPLAGRLILTPQQRTNYLQIAIVGDTDYEPSETFSIDWLEPNGAILPRTATTVTLLNDDPAPAANAAISLDPDGLPIVWFTTLPGVRYNLQSRGLAESGVWRAEGGAVTGDGNIMSLRPNVRTDDVWFYRVQAN